MTIQKICFITSFPTCPSCPQGSSIQHFCLTVTIVLCAYYQYCSYTCSSIFIYTWIFTYTRIKTVLVLLIFVFLQLSAMQTCHKPQLMLIQWIKIDTHQTRLCRKCGFPKSDLSTHSYQWCFGSFCLMLEIPWTCYRWNMSLNNAKTYSGSKFWSHGEDSENKYS